MLGLVEAGLGVAAVPSLAMPASDHPLLVSVPLTEPVVTRRVGLIRRRGRSLPPAAQQFYDLLLEMRPEAAQGVARASRLDESLARAVNGRLRHARSTIAASAGTRRTPRPGQAPARPCHGPRQFEGSTVSSHAPSHFETTMQATALLIVLVRARASDMKRSTPTISATPATGRSGITVSVATSATNPLPVSPARLDVSSISPSIEPICIHDSWMSHAWARTAKTVQVDGRAVQVERIAGREHEADDALLAPQALQLHQQAGQYGLGRRGAQHDQQFLTDVAHQLPELESVQVRQQAQHDDDEQVKRGRRCRSAAPELRRT